MGKVFFVEPVIFIYMFASYLTSPVVQQFIYRRLWEEEYNSTFISSSNTSYCEQNKSSTAYIKQKGVQEKTSLFNMQLDLTGAVPSLIVAFIIVANSDRQGRKRSLVLPSMGALIADIFRTLISYFSLSLSILFAVTFISGLFGSMATFLGGGFAYIADLCHDEKQKTTRIAVVDLIFGVVSGLAGLSSGYILREIGFTWTFVTASLLHVVNIIYIIFFLEDTVSISETQQQAQVSYKELLKETFSGVYMLFKTAPSKKRILIIVLLFTFMTYLFTVFGGSSLFTLYELDEPLCWNEVYIGYGAAAFTSVSLTSFLGVYFFSKCLKDIYIVFIGIFSYIGGIIMAAFAKTTLLMFLVRVPSLLCLMPVPVLRSMLSKVVLASEQATVAWFSGFSFLLSAGLCLIPLSALCWLLCTSWNGEDLALLVPDEVSSIDSVDS
ncbi:solute carrier family 46 member 3 isoform X2 [Cygnus atratus]|uniref:solute carrier family 46 member 3 isoform X2 n=1 Tax=Cygnus atratus TaxID=8868 RepID=UPI0015D5FC76|nr:solute carrier family 46 member 3 isoform X2 [Cygnus atratus]